MAVRNVTHAVQEILLNTSRASEDFFFSNHRHMLGNVFGSLVTILIAVVSLIGNLAVVIVSFCCEDLRAKPGNLLLVNLSIIDITTSISVMFPSAIAVAVDFWPLGSMMCKLHATMNYMCACASSNSLATIAADRAFAVTFPFKYSTTMSESYVIAAFLFAVSAGLSIGVPGGMRDWTLYNYSEGVCSANYAENDDTKSLVVAATVLCFVFPAIVIGFCYIAIIFFASKSNSTAQAIFFRRNLASQNANESGGNFFSLKKTIKSTLVIINVYYSCFIPYVITKQTGAYGIEMPMWFTNLSTIFIFISSATNPFIYAILRKDYWKAFKRLVAVITGPFQGRNRVLPM